MHHKHGESIDYFPSKKLNHLLCNLFALFNAEGKNLICLFLFEWNFLWLSSANFIGK